MPGNDEITLPKGTIKLKLAKGEPETNAEGDLDVTEAVKIDGRGPGKTVIEQTAEDRVLRNDAPFNGFLAPGLQLNDVTLTGGSIGGAGENGGAGFQNNAFALLSNVAIKKNVANSDSSDNVPGAGVYSSGTLSMAETTVSRNVARGRGETNAIAAGILVSDGGLALQDGSKVLRNKAELREREGTTLAQGGGIMIRNPGGEPTDTVSVVDSTIAGDSALGGPQADGGGIFAGSGTNLEIQRSTISGNRSKRGGGLYLVGTSAATIDNSTISGNSDTGSGGAAMFHQAVAGAIDITRTTIAGNDPSPEHFAIEAGEQAAVGSLIPYASIIFNPGKECGPAAEVLAVDSDGRSVHGDKSCGFDEASFDQKADPKLGPLAKNGGPTKTHALKPPSPAIDLVPCSPSIDQRGLPRPQRTDCDSGSFEKKF